MKFQVGDRIGTKDRRNEGRVFITRIEDGKYYYKGKDSVYEHSWEIEECDKYCEKLTPLDELL